jgi:hypothetical protein
MVNVSSIALKKGREHLAELAAVADATRLRTAAQAAGVAVFDWQVEAGAIAWEGATDILPFQRDIHRAAVFLDAIDRDKRGALEAMLDMQLPQSSSFLIDIEIASAMGAIAYTLCGTRFAGADGRTERLMGVMRDTTERTRELQRPPIWPHATNSPAISTAIRCARNWRWPSTAPRPRPAIAPSWFPPSTAWP